MTPQQDRKAQKDENAADVIRLQDLVPRGDINGGAKLRFGEATANKPRGHSSGG
jgi:hypothetical protein